MRGYSGLLGGHFREWAIKQCELENEKMITAIMNICGCWSCAREQEYQKIFKKKNNEEVEPRAFWSDKAKTRLRSGFPGNISNRSGPFLSPDLSLSSSLSLSSALPGLAKEVCHVLNLNVNYFDVFT